jgi:hypothetical protein
VTVNNCTNFNNHLSTQVSKHKKKGHDTWRWKPRSWLGSPSRNNLIFNIDRYMYKQLIKHLHRFVSNCLIFFFQIKHIFLNVLCIFTFQYHYINKIQTKKNMSMIFLSYLPCIVNKLNAYNFRPSTPIFDLLEHKYQDKWLQDRRKMEISKRQEETKVWKC